MLVLQPTLGFPKLWQTNLVLLRGAQSYLTLAWT